MRAAVTARLLVLALAPLATTRAEVVHVLEDFSDAQRFFTDAGASLGPGFWDSGAMNATTTTEGALRVDYETWYEPIVAGAAVTRYGRRAAAGAAAHLVGAARAQVIPADFSDTRRSRPADLSSPARRVRSLPHQFTRATTLYHAHWLAVSEMCQSPAKGAPGSSPS